MDTIVINNFTPPPTPSQKAVLYVGQKVKVKVKSLSHAQLFATPWTVAHQAPPSMEFSRQEYWSELPFLSPWRAELSLILRKNLFSSPVWF